MELLKKLYHADKFGKKLLLEKANPLELKVFEYAYGSKKFNIKPIYIPSLNLVKEPTQEMFDLLDEIAEKGRNTETARKINNYGCKVNPLIFLILNRNLGIGVGKKLLEELGIIEVFKIQKAKEYNFNKLERYFYIEPKLDGCRIIVKNLPEETKFYLSSGREVKIPSIEPYFKYLAINTVYDGELVYGDGKQDKRLKISSLVTSSNKTGIIDSDKIKIVLFDCIPLQEWNRKFVVESLCKRKYRLNNSWLFNTPAKENKIEIVESLEYDKTIIDSKFIEGKFQQMLDLGYEGLMLKNSHTSYNFKRSFDWMKLKAIKTADLKIVGVKYYQGNKHFNIGSFICKGFAENKPVVTMVGSGLTDGIRQLTEEEVLGRFIEVKYNYVIKDNADTYSLYLPRFIRFRDDK